jgi:hypothetical protein
MKTGRTAPTDPNLRTGSTIPIQNHVYLHNTYLNWNSMDLNSTEKLFLSDKGTENKRKCAFRAKCWNVECRRRPEFKDAEDWRLEFGDAVVVTPKVYGVQEAPWGIILTWPQGQNLSRCPGSLTKSLSS